MVKIRFKISISFPVPNIKWNSKSGLWKIIHGRTKCTRSQLFQENPFFQKTNEWSEMKRDEKSQE